MLTKQQFVNAVKENLRIMGGNEAAIQRDFIEAAEFVYDNFVIADTSTWNAQDLVNFIRKTHFFLVRTLYAGRNADAVPGEFRADELLVTRHNPNADYERSGFAPKIILGAVMFMNGEYPKEVIKQFMVAYHKYFHTLNPFPEHYNRSKDAQKALEKFAPTLGIRISNADFYDAQGKEIRLTGEEKKALNYIYKLYPDFTNLNHLMDTFGQRMLDILKTPNEEASAIFFHEFLQIEPFLDGNGRLARLITNAIRAKLEQPIINLNTSEAREKHEYSIDLRKDPTLESIINLFREIEPSPTSKQDIIKCFGEAFWKKYNTLGFELEDKDGKKCARLVGFQINPAKFQSQYSQVWFDKKLQNAQISYRWAPNQEGMLQLLFYPIDASTFNFDKDKDPDPAADEKMVEEKPQSMASLISALGCLSVSQKIESLTRKQDIMDCLGEAFQKRYPLIEWKLTNYNGGIAVSLEGYKLKVQNKQWFEGKLTQIEHAWVEKPDGNLQLLFTRVDLSTFNIAESSEYSSSSGQTRSTMQP